MLKINEIFYSFQGEGVYIGTPALFLRLSECNLNCTFCDTDFSKYYVRSIELLKKEIEEKMEKHNVELLVITGGEPLLQYNELKQLINQLKCNIQIETNGTIMKKPLNATYIISPKTKIEKIFKFYKDYENTYFKFIIQNNENLEEINQLSQKYHYDKIIYLQPEYSKAKKITKSILSKNLNFKYKISGQLHKYLGVE